MRGNGNGGAVVWVFDERRRVRDEVAGRLLALPFVSRVEAVGDAVSLRTRLDNRLPDVLLVGTQRATDSGLSVATQVNGTPASSARSIMPTASRGLVAKRTAAGTCVAARRAGSSVQLSGR